MAGFSMGSDGWSELLQINWQNITGSNPWNQTSGYNVPQMFTDEWYDPCGPANWFQQSYWRYYTLGKKYININSVDVKFTTMQFLACAGNSEGLPYSTTVGGGVINTGRETYGNGCQFVVDLYLINANGSAKQYIHGASAGVVEGVDQFNCYYDGPDAIEGGPAGPYGNTTNSPYHTGTRFAEQAEFGTDENQNQYSLDSKGRKRYKHTIPFDFGQEIVLRPNEGFYLTMNVPSNSWGVSVGDYDLSGTGAVGDNNCLLSVNMGDPYFIGTIEPADSPYIWRFDGTQWQLDRRAYQYTNEGWRVLRNE